MASVTITEPPVPTKVLRVARDLSAPFSTHDVHAAYQYQHEVGAIHCRLEALHQNGHIIRPADLAVGWWRIPATAGDLVRAAQKVSKRDLSPAMKAAVRASFRGRLMKPGRLRACTPPHRQTIRALVRRGVAERCECPGVDMEGIGRKSRCWFLVDPLRGHARRQAE